MNINLKDIILDSGMVKSIRKSQRPCCAIGNKVLFRDNTFELSKLEQFNDILINSKQNYSFPNIRVKKFKNTKYYEVIDGRHRTVVSLILGKTYINAELLPQD